MTISEIAVKHKPVIYILFAIIVIVGTVSYMTIPRESSPSITIPYIFISTTYAGASPQDMEQLVTQEIENQIDSVLDEVRRGEITDNELTKVKNKIETAFNSRRQTIIGLADKLSGIKTFFGDTNLINTEINFYLNITRDDLVNTSKDLLGRDQRLVLNYLPKQ